MTTNARIEWAGVRIDEMKRDEAIVRIGAHKERLEEHLAAEYGILNSRSHKQLSEFFRSCSLLSEFIKNGKVSFDKKSLKKNAALHPAIAVLRAARRASDLLADKFLSSEFVSEDGRVRAQHRQLGERIPDRQTSRWPNLLGLDRVSAAL